LLHAGAKAKRITTGAVITEGALPDPPVRVEVIRGFAGAVVSSHGSLKRMSRWLPFDRAVNRMILATTAAAAPGFSAVR